MRLKTIPIALNNKSEMKEYGQLKKKAQKENSDITKITKELWRKYVRQED